MLSARAVQLYARSNYVTNADYGVTTTNIVKIRALYGYVLLVLKETCWIWRVLRRDFSKGFH